MVAPTLKNKVVGLDLMIHQHEKSFACSQISLDDFLEQDMKQSEDDDVSASDYYRMVQKFAQSQLEIQRLTTELEKAKGKGQADSQPIGSTKEMSEPTKEMSEPTKGNIAVCSVFTGEAYRLQRLDEVNDHSELHQRIQELEAEQKSQEQLFKARLDMKDKELMLKTQALNEKTEQVEHLQTLSQEVKDSNEEAEALREALRQANEKLEKASSLQHNLKATMSLLRKRDAEIKKLKGKIENSKGAEVGDLNRIQIMATALQKTKVALVKSETTANILQSRLDQATLLLSKKDSRISELQVQSKVPQGAIRVDDTVQAALDKKSSQELRAVVEKLQQELYESQEQVKKLERQSRMTRKIIADLSDAEDELASLKERHSQLQNEYDHSLDRATEMSISLAESRMKVDELANKLKHERKGKNGGSGAVPHYCSPVRSNKTPRVVPMNWKLDRITSAHF